MSKIKNILFLVLICIITNLYANENDKTREYSSLSKEIITDDYAKKNNSYCELSPSEVIRIACTKKCNKHYTSAIQKVARKLKYRVEFLTLKSVNIDYNTLPYEIDGIISPGGHDIEPKYYTKSLSKEQKTKIERLFRKYGNTNKLGQTRDAFEYELFDRYLTNDNYKNIPVLGICYGMQMLAAVKQIPLYVHIPANINIRARRRVNDKITLNEKSSLIPFFKNSSFTGYKNHHQAIDMAYFNSNKSQFTDISITGTSNNNKIAEIIELHNRPAVGVQFHPERSTEKTKIAIFSHFLKNTCLKKSIQSLPSVKTRQDKIKSWQDAFHKYPSIQQIFFYKGYIVKTSYVLNSKTIDIVKKATTLPIVGYLETKEGRFYMSKWNWEYGLKGNKPTWILKQ